MGKQLRSRCFWTEVTDWLKNKSNHHQFSVNNILGMAEDCTCYRYKPWEAHCRLPGRRVTCRTNLYSPDPHILIQNSVIHKYWTKTITKNPQQPSNRTKKKGWFTPNALKEGQDKSGFVNHPRTFVLDGRYKRRAEDTILISAFSQLVVVHCFFSGIHRSLMKVKDKF